MKYLFDKSWFKKHQRGLLWLLNFCLIKRWFRWVLRIWWFDCSLSIRITELTPNSFSWGDRYFKKKGKWYLERTTDFRTHNKYSKRLFYAFYPLWYLFHCWDWVIGDRILYPRLSFGFATLTVYPDPGTGATTVDGQLKRTGVAETTSVIKAGVGTDADATIATGTFCGFDNHPSIVGVQWTAYRSVFLFDTSSLGSNAVVSSGIIHLWSIGIADNTGSGGDEGYLALVAVSTVSNNNLQTSDFNVESWNSINLASRISGTNWNNAVNSYVNMSLLSAGINNISKTGISKFGVRHGNCDIDGTYTCQHPSVVGRVARANGGFADQVGTTNDPKLVITYSIPAVKDKMFLMF